LSVRHSRSVAQSSAASAIARRAAVAGAIARRRARWPAAATADSIASTYAAGPDGAVRTPTSRGCGVAISAPDRCPEFRRLEAYRVLEAIVAPLLND
jgi:hypothetical protein